MNAEIDTVTPNDCQQVYRKAIEHFGTDHRYLKAVEECNELATTLLHYRDGKVSFEDLVGEVADVIIMTDQLRLILSSSAIDRAVINKTTQLKNLMCGGVDEARIDALVNKPWLNTKVCNRGDNQ